jgi:hypothetical protein
MILERYARTASADIPDYLRFSSGIGCLRFTCLLGGSEVLTDGSIRFLKNNGDDVNE